MLPKERKYFVTGNATFETRIPCLVLIPHSQDEWLYLTFFGALQYMADVASWFTGGETTPDEAAQIFQTAMEGARSMLFMIGMVSDFAAPLPDDSGWLQCDGTLYLGTDYQELYDAIGTTYAQSGDPMGYFRVPDTRGRARVTINSGETRLPAWADDPGGTGGEADHTLDVSEMPSHAHTDAGHFHTVSEAGANATTIGPGVPEPTAIPVPFAPTSSGNADIQPTGGDGAHNNVQPSIALYTYILAWF
jgi:microcystin-dependent protein